MPEARGGRLGRSHPTPEPRGLEELPRLRPGAKAKRSYPQPEARSGAREELSHVRGQGGGQEVLPHARG